MIYRGQAYGAPVGEWWTTSASDAEKFAMAAGGNRTYVVLGLSEDDEEWLAKYRTSSPLVQGRPVWYRIPASELRTRWSGVVIISGAISLEEQP